MVRRHVKLGFWACRFDSKSVSKNIIMLPFFHWPIGKCRNCDKSKFELVERDTPFCLFLFEMQCSSFFVICLISFGLVSIVFFFQMPTFTKTISNLDFWLINFCFSLFVQGAITVRDRLTQRKVQLMVGTCSAWNVQDNHDQDKKDAPNVIVVGSIKKVQIERCAECLWIFSFELRQKAQVKRLPWQRQLKGVGWIKLSPLKWCSTAIEMSRPLTCPKSPVQRNASGRTCERIERKREKRVKTWTKTSRFEIAWTRCSHSWRHLKNESESGPVRINRKLLVERKRTKHQLTSTRKSTEFVESIYFACFPFSSLLFASLPSLSWAHTHTHNGWIVCIENNTSGEEEKRSRGSDMKEKERKKARERSMKETRRQRKEEMQSTKWDWRRRNTAESDEIGDTRTRSIRDELVYVLNPAHFRFRLETKRPQRESERRRPMSIDVHVHFPGLSSILTVTRNPVAWWCAHVTWSSLFFAFFFFFSPN